MIGFEWWMLRYPLTAARTLVYSKSYSSLVPPEYSRSQFLCVLKEATSWYDSIYKQYPTVMDLHSDGIVHSHWAKTILEFQQIILTGQIPQGFLNLPIIQTNMVPRGWSQSQVYELSWLLENNEIADKIRHEFVESRVGWPHLECKELNCSSSTLLHLYTVYQMTASLCEFSTIQCEQWNTVVEWGGGYGGFCRTFLFHHQPEKYIIVDFAEMLIFQYVFLKLTEPSKQIYLWGDSKNYKDCDIILIPIQAFERAFMDLECDLFVSHVALSESGLEAIKRVIALDYFNADLVHVIGDRKNRWKAGNLIPKTFNESIAWESKIRSHHIGDNRYDIIAWRR